MIKPSRTTFTFAAIVSLGGFLFGFDATVISGALGFVTRQFHLDDWQRGLLVSAPTVTAALAALTVGPLADRMGRRRMLQVLALFYTASGLTSSLAPSFQTLISARLLGGYAFGTLLLAPLYIAEIAPAKQRGFLVSVNQLNIVVGFSAAYFSNFFLLQISQSPTWDLGPEASQQIWRWMFGLEAIPAVAYLVLLSFVPESPRWLMVQGRTNAARQVLARIKPTDQLAESLRRIRLSMAQSPGRGSVGLADLLRPELRFPLTLGLIVAVAQQITGVNAIYFYAPTIFEQSGVGTNAALAQAVWIGLTNILFTLLAMTLIDRVGRKPLLVLGLTGVLCSLGLSAQTFHQATYQLSPEAIVQLEGSIAGIETLVGVEYDNDLAFKKAVRATLGEDVLRNHQAALIMAAIQVDSTLILIGILGFVASFAISLGPVMWVLLSEIFPNDIRGVAMSLVTFFNSAVSFAVQFFFPWQLSNIGSAGTFLTYAVFAAVALVLVICLLPETKGRSLEQLEHEIGGR